MEKANMANGKELGLSTEREFKDGVLTITVSEVEKGDEGSTPTGKSESLQVSFAEVFGDTSGLTEIGLRALEFGAFTQYRNATGGRSLAEAIERMNAIAEAHRNGEWTTRGGPRGMGAGLPFPASSDWVAALCQVYPQHFADKTAAAQWLNSQINVDAWAGFDDEQKSAARKAVREKLAQDRKVADARKAIADARKEAKAPAVDKPLFS